MEGLLLILLGLLLLVGGLVLTYFVLTIVVIVQKASEPRHLDMGEYRLDQGREVKSENHES